VRVYFLSSNISMGPTSCYRDNNMLINLHIILSRISHVSPNFTTISLICTYIIGTYNIIYKKNQFHHIFSVERAIIYIYKHIIGAYIIIQHIGEYCRDTRVGIYGFGTKQATLIVYIMILKFTPNTF